MNKQISPKIISITAVIFVAVFAFVFYIIAWTEPANSPPTCPSGSPGCDSPINVSASTQSKSGSLTIGGLAFETYNNAYLATLGGNVGIGTPNPAAKLDVAGGIKLADDLICNAAKAGTIRYNAGVIEFCNGAGWQAIGGSAAAGLYGYCDSNIVVPTACNIALPPAFCTCGPAPCTGGGCACPAGYTLVTTGIWNFPGGGSRVWNSCYKN